MSVSTELPGQWTARQCWLRLAACLVLTGLSGCGLKEWVHNGFKVGPNYCPPVEPVASSWIDEADPRVQRAAPRLADWWTSFNDPTLDQLVQSAYFQNLTLRQAGARILEFRARQRFAVGTLFPQLQEAVGGFKHEHLSSNVANVRPVLNFNQWDAGFNASWELDFWGRFRRSIEAADAELDASVENYDDVLVLLLADVASAYTELRTFQQRLDYVRNNVAFQESILQRAEDRLKVGVGNELGVAQSRSVLEETRTLIPVFEAGARFANNQLCVLLGIPPRDLTTELGEGPIPSAASEVAVGIPADLVRRRPDVRQAERELAAQSARIGIAKSALYPHLGLNGSIGVSAQDFDGLFDGSRGSVGNFGPFMQWDILNYGRLTSLVDIQDARFEQALWAYQNLVLVAGREVEDGLVAYLRGQERIGNLDSSVQAAERVVEVAEAQWLQGVSDSLPLNIFSARLAGQQDQLAETQGATAQGLISLYRALGGGWQIRLNPGLATSRPANGNPPVPVESAPPATQEPGAEEQKAADEATDEKTVPAPVPAPASEPQPVD